MKQTKYGADKNILIAPELSFRVGVQVGNTGITADENGKKIVKAGTPLGASADVLATRETVMSAILADSALETTPAQGVLMHDVDVTSGNANATMIVTGQVDLLKLDSSVSITEKVKEALPKIQFVTGRVK